MRRMQFSAQSEEIEKDDTRENEEDTLVFDNTAIFVENDDEERERYDYSRSYVVLQFCTVLCMRTQP
jgi:hypothetical protein